MEMTIPNINAPNREKPNFIKKNAIDPNILIVTSISYSYQYVWHLNKRKCRNSDVNWHYKANYI